MIQKYTSRFCLEKYRFILSPSTKKTALSVSKEILVRRIGRGTAAPSLPFPPQFSPRMQERKAHGVARQRDNTNSWS